MKRFGLNFSDIPAIAVNIDVTTLGDRNTITDDKGHVLIYMIPEEVFKIFTNNQDDYLTIDELNNTWRKL